MEPQLHVTFDADKAELRRDGATVHLAIPVPHLAGPNVDQISCPGGQFEAVDGLMGFRSSELLVGAVTVPVTFPLAKDIEQVYKSLIKWLDGFHLYRVWNFVPQINQLCDGLEHYRSFSLGRGSAFEKSFGSSFEPFLPAASAVGLNESSFILYFIGGKQEPQHFENAEQVSAFHYPNEYGPRSPSFARGTSCGPMCFLSGTASIKGHQTIGVGDLQKQCEITKDNVDIVLKSMGVNQRQELAYKIYIRHRRDSDFIQQFFKYLGPQVTYLEADICRPDLDVEVEATLS